MTTIEYHKKLSRLMASEATPEAKQRAIEALRAQYNTTTSVETAKRQLVESAADTHDLIGH